MPNEYGFTLEEARKFVAQLSDPTRIPQLDQIGGVLKRLALAADKENFKRIVETLKTGDKDALRKLEWICMCMDHSAEVMQIIVDSARTGQPMPKPEMRITQAYFHELYGSHFYKQ